MRRLLRLASVLSLMVGVGGACSSSQSGEPMGQRKSSIWNGVEFPAAPGGIGVVRTQLGDPARGPKNGSGVALNNRWELTVAHVRENANVGTTTPALKSIHADFGAPPAYEARFATGVTKAPLGGAADPKYDLDLYRFDPIAIGGSTSGYRVDISNGTTEQIIALDSITCYGWGLGGDAGTAGKLRAAELDPNFQQAEQLFRAEEQLRSDRG